ncbi:MAG: hypothetical protein AAF604_23335 [Acidobacteriota bacterium]
MTIAIRLERFRATSPESTEALGQLLQEELLPAADGAFGQVTRISRGVLEGQELLAGSGEFLWISEWSGAARDLASPALDEVLMNETSAYGVFSGVLERCSTLAEREVIGVYTSVTRSGEE